MSFPLLLQRHSKSSGQLVYTKKTHYTNVHRRLRINHHFMRTTRSIISIVQVFNGFTIILISLIILPAIRCEFGTMNAKYQMHLRLQELANPSIPPLYRPISINKSVHNFSEFLKGSFSIHTLILCSQPECYVCANSN